MNYAITEQPSLDYFPCKYGGSKQLFRGPRRRLEGEYVAYVGGTETYGKFIDLPFPALVEFETGLRSVNLGCVNAGIDVCFNDRSLMKICRDSCVTVMQITGAQNLSNRFYSVHPRRNDRFLHASPLLQQIFPEVDFTDFSFTRHMLTNLAEISEEKFSLVIHELKEVWVGRMAAVLSQIGTRVVLLWLADHPPSRDPKNNPDDPDPLFVDRHMLDALSGSVATIVEVIGSERERREGLEEMFFGEFERPAAAAMLGPVVHRRVTEALGQVLQRLT